MNQMGSVERGVATIIGIGTANPPNIILQSEYPDFYFRVTKSDHMLRLKEKFNRICKKSKIEKRHFVYNEAILKENTNISTYGAPSLDARQDILMEEIPKLGKEAAMNAIREWGQPLSRITHLIFYTNSTLCNSPSADYLLAKLLGLNPTVKRLMLFNVGCHGAGVVLRVAKDIAENNSGSRVLVVWTEVTMALFHGPNTNHLDVLVGQSLFGDGAAAIIIGADPNINNYNNNPDYNNEVPLFELSFASQTTIPNTESVAGLCPQEMGLVYYIGKEMPSLVSGNIGKCIIEAFNSIGMMMSNDKMNWNSLFYVIHPGGPAILDKIEKKLGLKEEKLRATRQVLSQYGNMVSASMVFVLDEMRKRSKIEGKSTTGEGLERGVLVAFGPGISFEIMVLRILHQPSLFVLVFRSSADALVRHCPHCRHRLSVVSPTSTAPSPDVAGCAATRLQKLTVFLIKVVLAATFQPFLPLFPTHWFVTAAAVVFVSTSRVERAKIRPQKPLHAPARASKRSLLDLV
ncbi:Chitin synthase, class 2 [Stylosanthes scabra]|uniref:Chitin synthase, class 2 n=1 Tax=Stylosanthes scabra TaxID=79078 RepID=A0ABU6RAW9_9FABA|nr:Chitin synthase, class 2 [Stylosanthes scabra]